MTLINFLVKLYKKLKIIYKNLNILIKSILNLFFYFFIFCLFLFFKIITIVFQAIKNIIYILMCFYNNYQFSKLISFNAKQLTLNL